jgi:nitroimidazol reductase NimA-like FMN-containing flavoprotein (pyridoxamine 5'-phosphate oxidase superfamily)
MDQQEIDGELARTGAHELLTSTSMAHLAYTGNDGTPRVIPIGFFWTGDQVVVCTAATHSAVEH